MLPATWLALGLAVLALTGATAAAAQARTEVRVDATLRYGLGGDFAAHGFGTTGFIIAEAHLLPARWSLPNDITMQGHPTDHLGDPLPQFRDLYLTGGSSRPGLTPRRSWWSQRPDLWFRFSVPRCLQVTLYLLDVSDYPAYGPVNVRFDAGQPSERLFHVDDARSGVYLSFNMTVGSANMTIEKVNHRDEVGLIAAGVLFDELPAGSACKLARPKTTPWALQDGGATLLYNAGGNMSALGFGGRASWLPPPDQTRAAVTFTSAAGYGIEVSRPFAIGSANFLPSDDRLLVPPSGERRSLTIVGNGGGDLTFTVTVPRCSLVRLYVVDLNGNIQEGEIRRPGLPTVRLSHGLLQGTWVTFTQQTGTAQYITNKVRGPNLPLLAVTVDDGPDDCVFATPAPPPPSPALTPVPPPTPAPACAIRFTATGVALRPGIGGDFRGDEVGFGDRGWVLGNRWNEALPFTGYDVAFPQAMASGWASAAPSGYPTGRLLAPPNTQPWPEVWYTTPGFDIVVTVPRCTLVTFYFLDFDSDARRFSLYRDGTRQVDYTCSFDEGVYVTVPQTSATATYSILRTRGANAVLSGMMFDDHADSDCVIPTSFEPSANGNANNDGRESNTIVIAVVAALAVGAVCAAVAVGVVLAARNRVNNNRNDNGDEEEAEMGNVAVAHDQPVVGAVVAPASVAQPAEAPGGVQQCPSLEPSPSPYGYPPNSTYARPHPGYPAQPQQQQSSYGPPAAAAAAATASGGECLDQCKKVDPM